MKIRLLGAHNCESKNTKLTSMLIDDVLVVDTGGLTSSLSFPAQQKLKVILLTHQHYDHVKDIPSITFNFAMANAAINIYSTRAVYQALSTYLLNGELYPKFLGWPQEDPRINFNVLEPYRLEKIEGYQVLPIPVNHSVTTVGYQITSPDGKVLFYTGDTGPGLADCWEWIEPQLLIIETSAPDRFIELYQNRGHLTPALLKQELTNFREIKGYLPQVVVVHVNPRLEDEIKEEIAAVSQYLKHPISVGYEGMPLYL